MCVTACLVIGAILGFEHPMVGWEYAHRNECRVFAETSP